ncbi:signal peptide peptidase SppA [Syntrophomonas erecta]
MHKRLVVALFVVFILIMTVVSVRETIGPGPKNPIANGPGVGVIEINGPIAGGSVGSWTAGSSASGMQVMETIRQAGEREDIKVVVLRLDTPGGTSVAAQEIGIELDKLRKKGKKVVTSMGDVCASAGYWIACSSDYVVANEGTLTGSIGVIMEVANLEGLYDKLGIRTERIKSGEHKDMGSPARPLTDSERGILQNIVGDSYQQFLDQVLKGRQGKIEPDELVKIADGRVISGQQALELGLVDSLGNYYDAIDMARQLANLNQDAPVKVLNTGNFWNRLVLNMKIFDWSGWSSSTELRY